MEKNGFGQCYKWLDKVTEDSIKDFETFRATFNDLEPTEDVNRVPKKISKKKDMEVEEDSSYKDSGDVDSDINSEEEKEPDLHIDDFLDEGLTIIL